MAGGKYSGTPIAAAWIHKKAWEIGLEGQNLFSALAYAETKAGSLTARKGARFC